MSEGRLRCSGSPLFLKKTYGVGYQLTVEKISETDSEDTNEMLKGIVKDAVPEATLLSNVGSELSYQLPIGAASQFSSMFSGLDGQIEKGTVSTYGVSITTLDEVFLMVARGEDPGTSKKEAFASARKSDSVVAMTDEDKSARSRMNLNEDNLFFTHLGALFRKRAANFRRDKKAWVCTSIVPSIFVFIGLLLFTFVSPNRDLEPLVLTLDEFNPDVTVSPKNPIAFNSPSSVYTCNPGSCVYQSSPIEGVSGTTYFCGERSDIEGNCSITESASVADWLLPDGTPIGVEASEVSEVRQVAVAASHLTF